MTGRKRQLLLFLPAAALASMQAGAETEIYRCALEDGTTAFQEMPCEQPAPTDAVDATVPPAAESMPAGDDFFDFVNPYDEPRDITVPAQPELPGPVSQDRDECIDQTRAAIDVIDAKLAEDAASAEDSRAQLAELLELTRQLRACKAL